MYDLYNSSNEVLLGNINIQGILLAGDIALTGNSPQSLQESLNSGIICLQIETSLQERCFLGF